MAALTLSVTTQVLHGKACGARRTAAWLDTVGDGALSACTDENGPTALIRSTLQVHDMNLQSTLIST